MTAVGVPSTFIYIYTLLAFGFKTRLTLAEVPAWHVNTVGCLLATMETSRTLIQISFARVTHVPGTAGANPWSSAFSAIQTSLIADRLAVMSIASVSRLAGAIIRSYRVGTVCMLVAPVLSRFAFVHLNAAKFVLSAIAGQTLAHV